MCPHCGYCPHCGRSAYPYYPGGLAPYNPQYPYNPIPILPGWPYQQGPGYYPFGTTTGGQNFGVSDGNGLQGMPQQMQFGTSGHQQ